MYETLFFIVGFGIGYFTRVLITHEPKARFIEPKEQTEATSGEPQTITVTAQFVEAITPNERFKKAKDVSDLLNT